MSFGAVAAAAWFLLVVPASAQQPEEVLRARVKEFYTFLQQGQTTRAEAYVSRDSVDTFRRSDIGLMQGMEISSVELDPSSESATVTVQILYKHPMVPASPLRFPRTTTWRLEDGAWRVVIVQTPGTVAGMAPRGEAQAPLPEELQFSEKTRDLGVFEIGNKKPVRFSFKNVTDHPVTISGVETGCPCLSVLSGIKTYQSGETGELVVEFDSTGYLYDYKQTMVVKTEPGHLTTNLLVQAKPMPPQMMASPQQSSPPPSSGTNP